MYRYCLLAKATYSRLLDVAGVADVDLRRIVRIAKLTHNGRNIDRTCGHRITGKSSLVTGKHIDVAAGIGDGDYTTVSSGPSDGGSIDQDQG